MTDTDIFSPGCPCANPKGERLEALEWCPLVQRHVCGPCRELAECVEYCEDCEENYEPDEE